MDKWTLVLAHTRTDDALAAHADRELAALLEQRGPGDLVVTGDLYDLPGDDPLWRELAGTSGGLLLLSRHHPRALFWLLSARGVEGRRADLEGGEGRPIHCLDLRRWCCPDKVVDQVVQLAGTAPAGSRREEAGEQRERWYPVIDYDRCTGCLECLEFCLFGVYDRAGDGRPLVAEPDKCKPGCPACSRVCPAAAIIFPRHGEVAAIAGADSGEIPPFRVEDLDPGLIPAECADAVKEHLRGCACSPAAGGPEKEQSPADCGCAGPPPPASACDCGGKCVDPVDRALDRLDEEEI